MQMNFVKDLMNILQYVYILVYRHAYQNYLILKMNDFPMILSTIGYRTYQQVNRQLNTQ